MRREFPLAAVSHAPADQDILAVLRGDRTAAEVATAAGITETDVLGARSEFLARRLPAATATLKAETSGTVEILRDRAWVPHIFAKSTADLWYGVGFAMAQ